eukprot:TRINITY_DN41363_c0_g1_i1.p1 TRINITY_DN41363_c0_g1~~TRINITY_DN41363_c0_g1_i1.p1  ORF type:complete len:750 (+),score=85.53 TRINITY_DN41363_c0_g1_i1:127-2376(+)
MTLAKSRQSNSDSSSRSNRSRSRGVRRGKRLRRRQRGGSRRSPSKESLCKFGRRGDRMHCRFVHRDGCVTDEGGARGGGRCLFRRKCHPDDSEIDKGVANNDRLCCFGRRCHRNKCPFEHPDGRAIDENSSKSAQGGAKCLFGRRCTRKPCFFSHPDGREIDEAPARTGRNCFLGRSCTRNPCSFEHPDGREIDEASAKRIGRSREAGSRRRRNGKSTGSRRRCTDSQSPLSYGRGRSHRQRRGSCRNRIEKPCRDPQHRKPASRVPSASNSENSSSSPTGRSSSKRSTSSIASNGRATSSRKHGINGSSSPPTDQGLRASPKHATAVQPSTVLSQSATRRVGEVAAADVARSAREEFPQLANNKEEEMHVSTFQKTGLFYDLYHPVATSRSFDLRLCMARRNASQFLDDLQKGTYEGLKLHTSSPPGFMSASLTVLQPPQFAFDPDVASLLIKGLPCTISAWDICDCLQDCRGFINISWTSPTANLRRDVYASFATEKQAQAAIAALPKETAALCHVADSATAGVTNSSFPDSPREPSCTVLPLEMSSPDRITKDVALSARVIKCLGKLCGVQSTLMESLLSHAGPPELKLDIQIMYLRRAHHFCFYTAVWCKDEWELRDKCGRIVLRHRLPADSKAAEEGDTAAAHERRLEQFLGQASIRQPQHLSIEDSDMSLQLANLAGERSIKINDTKLKCTICGKYFRGQAYMSKHLKKMHTAIVDATFQKHYQELAHAAYLHDPEKPTRVHT